jgi:RNA polymerase sigma factor (sigma-70 family)
VSTNSAGWEANDTNENFDIDYELFLRHAEAEDLQQANIAAAAIERIIASRAPALRGLSEKFQYVLRLDREDFTQAGVVGIFDALARADPELPAVAFRRYMERRIYNFMFDESAKAGGAVTLNQGILKSIIIAKRIRREHEGGQSLDDLLDASGMTEQRYWSYLEAARLNEALPFGHMPEIGDQSVLLSGDHDSVIEQSKDPGDIFMEENNPTPEELLVDALGRLTLKERDIIENYYGINGTKQTSMREIAVRLGVSESRISQIASYARYKLKLFIREAQRV